MCCSFTDCTPKSGHEREDHPDPAYLQNSIERKQSLKTLRNANVYDSICEKEEARRLLEIYRPYVENTAITFEWDVPTLEEFEHRIETIQKHYPYLVLEEKGKIMGYAYVAPFKERQAYARVSKPAFIWIEIPVTKGMAPDFMRPSKKNAAKLDSSIFTPVLPSLPVRTIRI